MGAFFARQPNGLLCRHSTIVDCVTDYNMTEEDARWMFGEEIDKRIQPFSLVEESFVPNNMTEEEFEHILQEMRLPKESCTYTQT